MNAIMDMAGTNAKTSPSLDWLDARIQQHLAEVIEPSRLYQLMADPGTPPELATKLVRHAMVESFTFTPRIMRSTFRAIGMMPFDLEKEMKQACLHALEEVDHGDMALRTFIALGGDEGWAKNRDMTPESFAMWAALDRVIEDRGGLSYLGFMYPFEATTPILAGRVMGWLEDRGIGADRREFIDTHAEDDIAHMRSMRNLIAKVDEAHPEAMDGIKYACEVFFATYPVPIWDAVVKRAETA